MASRVIDAALKAFLEFLALNRNASAHTVRAYESDLSQFLDHVRPPRGRKRATSQPGSRPADAARFLAELHAPAVARVGGAQAGGGPDLRRYLRREGASTAIRRRWSRPPKREQPMPAHLSENEMTRCSRRRTGRSPLGRRDRAILELFYASGLRLSELVGLDLDDVNLSARMVRVLGKGGKERIVPFNQRGDNRAYLRDREALFGGAAEARGAPRRRRKAERGGRGARGRARQRGALPAPRRQPLFVNYRGGALTVAASIGWSPLRAALGASARTRCAIRSRRTCCSAAPTCARSRSCSGTRA